MSQCKAFCSYMWFLWALYAKEEEPTAYAGTITFEQIDLHIHTQQEQVFDVIFVREQQDRAALQGEVSWGGGDSRAVTSLTRDAVTQCPGKRSRACPATLTRSRQQSWSLEKSTVIREKAESAKQVADQQSARQPLCLALLSVVCKVTNDFTA